MKYNQNVSVRVGGYNVVTTMTKVLVYAGNKLVGIAGCLRASDFNFDTLFHLALHKSGSAIEM